MQRLTQDSLRPWTEKLKVKVADKGHSSGDFIKDYMHAKYNVINKNKNKLKCKVEQKILPWTGKVKVRVTRKGLS